MHGTPHSEAGKFLDDFVIREFMTNRFTEAAWCSSHIKHLQKVLLCPLVHVHVAYSYL